MRPIPSRSGKAGDPSVRSPAPDLVGTDPEGSPLEIRITETAGLVLLAFLATRCDGCDEFWRGFSRSGGDNLPPEVTPVIVTRAPDSTTEDEVARMSARTDVPVVMSDAAWVDYRVLGYPFLVLVDAASRTVVAEAVGFGWSDLEELVHDRAR